MNEIQQVNNIIDKTIQKIILKKQIFKFVFKPSQYKSQIKKIDAEINDTIKKYQFYLFALDVKISSYFYLKKIIQNSEMQNISDALKRNLKTSINYKKQQKLQNIAFEQLKNILQTHFLGAK
ncbi:hypothetical protein [[Mycoplasma] gypis]|uniref:Uncharacterized protein n=1 Tax=[Mycoplasma] gypis TaxID=92404 RepID=A0ABZ2RQG3_9BACT|nr:hypothetical protein [[Mycoplasma] gypis]MBN0919460.1 hypothetical protein [[Mycoplasma] gypis]